MAGENDYPRFMYRGEKRQALARCTFYEDKENTLIRRSVYKGSEG